MLAPSTFPHARARAPACSSANLTAQGSSPKQPGGNRFVHTEYPSSQPPRACHHHSSLRVAAPAVTQWRICSPAIPPYGKQHWPVSLRRVRQLRCFQPADPPCASSSAPCDGDKGLPPARLQSRLESKFDVCPDANALSAAAGQTRGKVRPGFLHQANAPRQFCLFPFCLARSRGKMAMTSVEYAYRLSYGKRAQHAAQCRLRKRHGHNVNGEYTVQRG